VVVAGDAVVARHERLSNAGETRYDWQHYIPLLQRKPGALRNGAPFADLPAPLQRLRRGLLRHPGGERVMAQVLAIVLTAGLSEKSTISLPWGPRILCRKGQLTSWITRATFSSASPMNIANADRSSIPGWRRQASARWASRKVPTT